MDLLSLLRGGVLDREGDLDREDDEYLRGEFGRLWRGEGDLDREEKLALLLCGDSDLLLLLGEGEGLLDRERELSLLEGLRGETDLLMALPRLGDKDGRRRMSCDGGEMIRTSVFDAAFC